MEARRSAMSDASRCDGGELDDGNPKAQAGSNVLATSGATAAEAGKSLRRTLADLKDELDEGVGTVMGNITIKADAAWICIFGHGLSELLLACRMSLMNMEQMQAARHAAAAGANAKQAAQEFLASGYYRNWSRAQLNNTEYAPMLALLVFVIKYKAVQAGRRLTSAEKLACFGSVFFSYVFIYAACTQKAIDHAKMRPGGAGMSPLRPIGALGRYLAMAWLLYHVIK